MFVELGPVEITEFQRARWKSGELAEVWARRYPELFDADDLRLARSQGGMGYHFIEWMAAIVLYESTGYLSLIAKYEFMNHPRKVEIVEALLPKRVLTAVRRGDPDKRAQAPDLLLYREDLLSWFFCEVKGPGDRLSPTQREYFERLEAVSGTRIRTLRFRWQRKTDSVGRGCRGRP